MLRPLGRDSIAAQKSAPMLEKLYTAGEESPNILHDVVVEAAMNTSSRKELVESAKNLPQACDFCVIEYRHYEVARKISEALLIKPPEEIDAHADDSKLATDTPLEILKDSEDISEIKTEIPEISESKPLEDISEIKAETTEISEIKSPEDISEIKTEITEISEIKSPENDVPNVIESEKTEVAEPLVKSEEQTETNGEYDYEYFEESEIIIPEVKEHLVAAARLQEMEEETEKKDKQHVVLVDNLMALHATILQTVKSLSEEQLKHYMESVFTPESTSKLEPEQIEALRQDLKVAFENGAENFDLQVKEIMRLKRMLNGKGAGEMDVAFKEISARLDECLEELKTIKQSLDKRNEEFSKAKDLVLSKGVKCCDAPDDELHLHGHLNGIPITLKLFKEEERYKAVEKIVAEKEKLAVEVIKVPVDDEIFEGPYVPSASSLPPEYYTEQIAHEIPEMTDEVLLPDTVDDLYPEVSTAQEVDMYTEVKEPSEEVKEPSEEIKGPLEEIKEPLGEVKEPLEEVKEPLQEIKEPSEMVKEPLEEIKEPSEEVKDTSEEVKEPSEEVKEPSEEITDEPTEKPEEVAKIQVEEIGEGVIQERTSKELIDPETTEALSVGEPFIEMKPVDEEKVLEGKAESSTREHMEEEHTFYEGDRKLPIEETEATFIKRKPTPEAEELYKLYVEEIKDLKPEETLIAEECETDLHKLEIVDDKILETEELLTPVEVKADTEVTEVETIDEVKDLIEEKDVDKEIAISELIDIRVASGTSSIGIPYYPSQSSLPPAILELIRDSMVARKSIDEMEKRLSDFELELLIKSSPAAPCARASVINEVQDPVLPYSPSLNSLPLRPEDIDEIQKRAEKYSDLAQNTNNQRPPANGRTKETANSSDMPWVVPDFIVEYVTAFRHNKSWESSQTGLSQQTRNDFRKIHKKHVNGRKLNKEDYLKKYCDYDCQSCDVLSSNSELLTLLQKNNVNLKMNQHVNSPDSSFILDASQQYSDCDDYTSNVSSCLTNATSLSNQSTCSQSTKDSADSYELIAEHADLIQIIRDGAKTPNSRKNREKRGGNSARKKILKYKGKIYSNLECSPLIKECNVKKEPKTKIYENNFSDTVGELTTCNLCVTKEVKHKKNVNLQEPKILHKTEHIITCTPSQEDDNSNPSWALIRLSTLSDGIETIELLETSDNPPGDIYLSESSSEF